MQKLLDSVCDALVATEVDRHHAFSSSQAFANVAKHALCQAYFAEIKVLQRHVALDNFLQALYNVLSMRCVFDVTCREFMLILVGLVREFGVVPCVVRLL